MGVVSAVHAACRGDCNNLLQFSAIMLKFYLVQSSFLGGCEVAFVQNLWFTHQSQDWFVFSAN